MLWWPFLVFSRLQRCSTKLFGLVHGWQWMGNVWHVGKGYRLQYASGIGCCKQFRQLRLGAQWLDESHAVLVGSRSNLFEAPSASKVTCDPILWWLASGFRNASNSIFWVDTYHIRTAPRMTTAHTAVVAEAFQANPHTQFEPSLSICRSNYFHMNPVCGQICCKCQLTNAIWLSVETPWAKVLPCPLKLQLIIYAIQMITPQNLLVRADVIISDNIW